MKTTKNAAEKIAALTARAARADLIEMAVNVLDLTQKTAAGLPMDMLTIRFAKEGFSEEDTLMALVDDFGFDPMGVNELCLSSMIALWLECIQPAPVAAAKPARKVAAPKAKATKLAAFPTATQLFGLKEEAVKAAKITAARTAGKPSIVGTVRGFVNDGCYTKQQIVDMTMAQLPEARMAAVKTMLYGLTVEKFCAGRLAVINETGIYSWA